MGDIQRFVFLPDAHVGWDIWHTETGIERRPTHDLGMVKLVSAFLKDFEPTHIIYGGDQLNSAAIGRWNKEKTIHLVQDLYVEETRIFREKFDTPFRHAAPHAERVWIDGNHDAWIYQWKDKYPQLESLLNPWGLIGISGPHGKVSGSVYIPQGGAFHLGKLTFVHGDQLPSTRDQAQATLRDWSCNIRYGHFHTFQAATKCDPQFQRSKKTAMSIPMLGQRNPAYGRGAANRYIQGFLYGYVSKATGNFSDFPVIVPGNKVIIEGKEYSK